jgi:large subunit ribosomal protein L25
MKAFIPVQPSSEGGVLSSKVIFLVAHAAHLGITVIFPFQMKQLNLNVQTREQSGRSASSRLRKAGRIPAVVYGPNGVRHLSIGDTDFRKLWKQVSGRTALIELATEGVAEPTLSIIQQIQRNSLTDEFTHIDFKEILRGRDMWATIAIRVVGEAFGVRNEGAVLELHRHDIEVRCRPRFLPEIIEINVENMKAGDTLKVKDLPKLEGVAYEMDLEVPVVSCLIPKVEEEKPAEVAAPAEGEAAAEGAEGAEGKAAEGAKGADGKAAEGAKGADGKAAAGSAKAEGKAAKAPAKGK